MLQVFSIKLFLSTKVISVQPSALPLTPVYSAIQQLSEEKEPKQASASLGSTVGKATEEKPAAAKKQKMSGTI